jgi:hypothetical protein
MDDLTVSLDAGWTPAVTKAHLRADSAIGTGAIRPFGGLGARLTSALFEMESEPPRDFPVTDLGVRLDLGIRWGAAE